MGSVISEVPLLPGHGRFLELWFMQIVQTAQFPAGCCTAVSELLLMSGVAWKGGDKFYWKQHELGREPLENRWVFLEFSKKIHRCWANSESNWDELTYYYLKYSSACMKIRNMIVFKFLLTCLEKPILFQTASGTAQNLTNPVYSMWTMISGFHPLL